MLEHGYSRVPVYRGDLDDVEGMIYAKDVLKALHPGKPTRRSARSCEAAFIPETKRSPSSCARCSGTSSTSRW